MNIQDLVPAADGLESGDYTIQFYDEYGALTNSIYYTFGEDIDEGYADGWYNDDGETLSTVVLQPGQAFFVYATRGDGKFTYSGEVNGAEAEIPVGNVSSAQGNFRPTSVNVQSIIPELEGGVESGDYTIQFYDEYGALTNSIYYTLGEDIDEGYEDGWYNDDGETMSTQVFEPGFGFVVYSTKAGGKFVFEALSL